MSLPQRPLGDALQLASQKVPVSADEEYRIAGIYSFGRGLIKRPTITGAETSYPMLTRIETGQLAMSKLNAWEGALAIVTDEFSGAHVSPEYPIFDINLDVADPAYIKHLIAWPTLWSRLTPRGSMVRRKRTTPATLMATVVPLPDLEEQRRIAARLDATASKIRRTEELSQNRDALTRALIESIISKAGKPRPFSHFLSPANNYTKVDPQKSYQTVGIYSYGRGIFTHPITLGSETKYIRYNSLRAGQLVYSKLNAWEGALAVVSPEFSGCYVSPEYPVFDIDETVADSAYVAHLVAWPQLWRRLTPRGSMVRRKRTAPATLLATAVPLPNLKEQRRIAEFLDKARQTKLLSSTQRTHLYSLKLSILNAEFSGKP